MFGNGAGWILLWAVLTSALTGPGQTLGVSVFIDHFVDDLGLSRTQVSGAYLVGTLCASLFLPAVGRFIDRRGVRVAQIIIGVLFAAALVNMSTVGGLISLAIGFTGIRLLGQGSLSLISTVTISLRFPTNRGTAIGLFSTLSGGLMALAPLALAGAIAAFGWRDAWLVAGLVIAVTVVPIAWFGLAPMPTTSADSRTRPATSSTVRDARSYNRSEALRTRGFWILAAVSASIGMLATALNFHQIDLLGDAGLSEDAAAAMFLPQVIGSTIAGFGFGYIADRVGSRYLLAVGMAMLITTHVLAAVASPGLAVITYAVMLGATGGATRTVTATLLPEWFGTAHLGAIQGTLTLLNVGATALGPVTLALAEGRFGSYPPAVLGLSVIPFAALLFSLTNPFPNDPDEPAQVIRDDSAQD